MATNQILSIRSDGTIQQRHNELITSPELISSRWCAALRDLWWSPNADGLYVNKHLHGTLRSLHKQEVRTISSVVPHGHHIRSYSGQADRNQFVLFPVKWAPWYGGNRMLCYAHVCLLRWVWPDSACLEKVINARDRQIMTIQCHTDDYYAYVPRAQLV